MRKKTQGIQKRANSLQDKMTTDGFRVVVLRKMLKRGRSGEEELRLVLMLISKGETIADDETAIRERIEQHTPQRKISCDKAISTKTCYYLSGEILLQIGLEINWAEISSPARDLRLGLREWARDPSGNERSSAAILNSTIFHMSNSAYNLFFFLIFKCINTWKYVRNYESIL